MRVTPLQVLPSADELITISFELQPLRKRQSDHTTNTLPAPSIPTEGRLGSRSPPATPWLLMLAIAWLRPQLWPPLVELNTSMPPPSKGTITVPFGCTAGSPPSPPAWSEEARPGPHVNPPSLDTLIITSPLPNGVDLHTMTWSIEDDERVLKAIDQVIVCRST